MNRSDAFFRKAPSPPDALPRTSHTPRTDELCKRKGNDWTPSEGDYIDLCEALERDLTAARSALLARELEIERLRPDAERWAWFREHMAPNPLAQVLGVPWTNIPPTMLIADKVDEVIDAAREATQEPKG